MIEITVENKEKGWKFSFDEKRFLIEGDYYKHLEETGVPYPMADSNGEDAAWGKRDDYGHPNYTFAVVWHVDYIRSCGETEISKQIYDIV